MLAGVTDCRRSWKWGCRGRLALGFKHRHGSHTGLFGDHAALVKVGTTQIWGAPFLPCGLGSKRDLAGKERGERTLAGRP